MKTIPKLISIFSLLFLLLLSVSISVSADNSFHKKEIWIRKKDGCDQGMYKQPNGPMSLILFCEGALGTYIGLFITTVQKVRFL